jgi:starvation-inducible DNA-binding protein
MSVAEAKKGTTSLHKTKNDLPENDRRELVELLNARLADALDLRMQAKQAHWNVKGPHFIGLHKLFDKVAGVVAAFTDEIAERAVQLGGDAEGRVGPVSRRSNLPEYPFGI